MGGRGSKINNPWNREGGKGKRVIYFVSHIVFVCWGEGEGGGMCGGSEFFH